MSQKAKKRKRKNNLNKLVIENLRGRIFISHVVPV